MLGLRVLSALIGIPIALLLIFTGGLPFTVAVAMLALIGLWELTQKFEGRGTHIVKEVAFSCVGAAVLGSYWVRHEYWLHLLVAIWWVGIFGSMFFHIIKTSGSGLESSGEWASSVASTVFAIAYLSLFALLVLLRDFKVSVSERPYPVGRDLILLTIASVWVTDSVAFFLGRTFGKEPLAPQISPGKTLEGSVAGTIGGFVTAWLFAWALISFGSEVTSQVWLNLARPVPFTLLALALGTLGQIGDLGKSVLKRSLGVKDFGSIIPGHGGVLDRFDSLLATTPIVYLYARWILG
jgi:phosphatidate cytidylyltransferase